MRRTRLAVSLAALMLVVSVLAASCGGGQAGGPLTAALSHDAPASASVGPEGGSVSTPGGTSVTIPAGALASAQTVTVALSTSSSAPSGASVLGPRYAFGPDGVTFSKPVTLTLAYDPVRIPAGKTAEPTVFMAPHGSDAFTALPTRRVDATHVAASTTHFTDFVVAYTEPTGSHVPSDANTKHLQKCPDPSDPATCHDGLCIDGYCYQPVVPELPVSGAFCDQFSMAKDLVNHPKSRLGRVHYDPQCSKHPVLCTASPPIQVSEPPTGCVEVEVLGGDGQPVADPANNTVQCVECPTRTDKKLLLPQNGGAPCSDAAVSLAKDTTGKNVIFNLNGYDVDWMAKDFVVASKAFTAWAAQSAKCQSLCSRSTPGVELNKEQVAACVSCKDTLHNYDAEAAVNGMTRIVRTLALELNYCTDGGPWGLPSPYPSYPPASPDPNAWQFSKKRPELNAIDFDKDLITINAAPAAAAGSGPALPPPCPPPTANQCTANVSQPEPASRDALSFCLPGTALSLGSPASTNPPGLNRAGQPVPLELEVAFSAFTTQTGPCFQFSVDQLALILVHEMRHMGTYNYGAGDPAANAEAKSVEHYLNELEDYEEMFKHPYFIGSGANMQLLHGLFDVGGCVEFACLQATWGAAGGSASMPVPGYPDDTGQSGTGPFMGNPGFMAPMPAIGGLGGLMMPMGVLGQFSPRRPPMPFKALPDAIAGSCLLNDVPTDTCTGPGNKIQTIPKAMGNPKDRCTVAKWAAANQWMESKMVRSMTPRVDYPSGSNGQPWNTLANYVLALPFRMQPYAACAGN